MRKKDNHLNFGARDAKLVEHGERRPCVVINYSVQWKRSILDAAELAQKRFIEGWTVKQLAHHFGRSENAIQCAYYVLRRRKFKHTRIGEKLRKKILSSLESDVL